MSATGFVGSAVRLQPTGRPEGANTISRTPLGNLMTDRDFDQLTFVQTAQCGALTFFANRTFIYQTTDSNVSSRDSLVYRASDAFAATDQATFCIDVLAINDVPVDDGRGSVAEDCGARTISFASLLANDSKGPANQSSQTLTITEVRNVVGGTAVIQGTDVVFTPAANFSGTASFEYVVQNNGVSQQTGNVTLYGPCASAC